MARNEPVTATDLQWRIAQQQIDIATLQAENRRLRRLTTNGKQGRVIHRTAQDARQLVAWRFSGYSISRRNCLAYGMSERRWAWAIALLKVAKVLDITASWADDFLLDDVQLCADALDRAVRKLESNGIGPLVFRLPRGRAVAPKR